jgi:hypothetical protein
LASGAPKPVRLAPGRGAAADDRSDTPTRDGPTGRVPAQRARCQLKAARLPASSATIAWRRPRRWRSNRTSRPRRGRQDEAAPPLVPTGSRGSNAGAADAAPVPDADAARPMAVVSAPAALDESLAPAASRVAVVSEADAGDVDATAVAHGVDVQSGPVAEDALAAAGGTAVVGRRARVGRHGARGAASWRTREAHFHATAPNATRHTRRAARHAPRRLRRGEPHAERTAV